MSVCRRPADPAKYALYFLASTPLKFESILKCPLTHGDLNWLSDEQLQTLNADIQQHRITQQDGRPWPKAVTGALKAQDRDIYYLVESNIYLLLPQLALVAAHEKIEQRASSELKATIQQFYDDFGWNNPNQHYQDAIDSEDLRGVSQDYINACHAKVNQHLPKQGRYLLDIASGPVQYPLYLSYSQHFDYRICADISIKALKEAQKKLQDKGIYLLCDLTQLPIKNDQIDAFVSLHTIYHIPKEEQVTAFQELNRALKPGGAGVVVYSWGSHSSLMKVFLSPLKWLNRLWRKIRGVPSSPLYFHAYDFGWYQKEIKPRFQTQLFSWRSVNVPFLKIFIHRSLGGKAILKMLLALENRFPKMMGRIGAYPMFVISK